MLIPISIHPLLDLDSLLLDLEDLLLLAQGELPLMVAVAEIYILVVAVDTVTLPTDRQDITIQVEEDLQEQDLDMDLTELVVLDSGHPHHKHMVVEAAARHKAL